MRGDREFDGNGPRWTVDVRLVGVGSRLVAQVGAHFQETKSDHTTFAGNHEYTVWDARSQHGDRKVKRVVGKNDDAQAGVDDSHDDQQIPGSGPAPALTIASKKCRSQQGKHKDTTKFDSWQKGGLRQ